MSAATREIKWLRQLMSDLVFPCAQPIRLFFDSQTAIHIAVNPVFHERTKHIEVDCHSVRDAITMEFCLRFMFELTSNLLMF